MTLTGMEVCSVGLDVASLGTLLQNADRVRVFPGKHRRRIRRLLRRLLLPRPEPFCIPGWAEPVLSELDMVML